MLVLVVGGIALVLFLTSRSLGPGQTFGPPMDPNVPMPGMNMGTDESPSTAPTMDPNMPGMDMDNAGE